MITRANDKAGNTAWHAVALVSRTGKMPVLLFISAIWIGAWVGATGRSPTQGERRSPLLYRSLLNINHI